MLSSVSGLVSLHVCGQTLLEMAGVKDGKVIEEILLEVPVFMSVTYIVFFLGLFGVVRTTWFVWCTTWLVPGNPFAPLGLNSNYDIYSATRLISN